MDDSVQCWSNPRLAFEFLIDNEDLKSLTWSDWFLADGPDWHLWSWTGVWLSLIACGDVCSDAIEVQGVDSRVSGFCFLQVSTNQFSLFAAFAFVFMTTDRACEDALHFSFSGPPSLSSNGGSPKVVVTTLMAGAPAPEVPWMWRTMPFFQYLYTSKLRSRKFLLSGLDVPYGFTYQENTAVVLCPVRQDSGLH